MQNNKKYWLRGGVVGLILSLIIVIIHIIFRFNCSFFIPEPGAIYDIVGCQYLNMFYAIEDLFGNKAELYFGIFGLLTIVGFIFGWIYGKIKNKNKV